MADPDPLMLYADTILVDGWCLRSSLVRYAQAEPRRATALHALMRRLDAALAGAASDATRREQLAPVVATFETLATEMSAWAADRRRHEIPTPSVDAVLAKVAADYERLDVPEESIDPAEWKGLRASEGRRAPRAKAATKPTPKQ